MCLFGLRLCCRKRQTRWRMTPSLEGVKILEKRVFRAQSAPQGVMPIDGLGRAHGVGLGLYDHSLLPCGL
jgi:predicted RNA-binding protein with PUA domain